MSETTQLTVLIVVLFPIVFAAIWFGVMWILALTGGWRALASRYAHQRPIPAAESGISGMVGWVGYNHVLKIACTDQYLFLDVMAPFRPGHPALRIPWRDIEMLGNARWPRRHHRVLRAGRPPLATLTLPERNATPPAAAGLR